MALFPRIGRVRLLRMWGGTIDMSMDGSPIFDRPHIDGLYFNGRRRYGVSGGWNANVHLTRHQRDRPVWNADIAPFMADADSIAGLGVAGAAASNFSTAAVLNDGSKLAAALLSHAGFKATAPPQLAVEDGPSTYPPSGTSIPAKTESGPISRTRSPSRTSNWRIRKTFARASI